MCHVLTLCFGLCPDLFSYSLVPRSCLPGPGVIICTQMFVPTLWNVFEQYCVCVPFFSFGFYLYKFAVSFCLKGIVWRGLLSSRCLHDEKSCDSQTLLHEQIRLLCVTLGAIGKHSDHYDCHPQTHTTVYTMGVSTIHGHATFQNYLFGNPPTPLKLNIKY